MSSKPLFVFFSVSAARAVVLRLPVTEEHHGYPEARWPWPCLGRSSGDLPGGAVWGGVGGEERGGDHLQTVWGQDHQGLPDLQDHGPVHQPRLSGRSGPTSQNCTWVWCGWSGCYACKVVLCGCFVDVVWVHLDICSDCLDTGPTSQNCTWVLCGWSGCYACEVVLCGCFVDVVWVHLDICSDCLDTLFHLLKLYMGVVWVEWVLCMWSGVVWVFCWCCGGKISVWVQPDICPDCLGTLFQPLKTVLGGCVGGVGVMCWKWWCMGILLMVCG